MRLPPIPICADHAAVHESGCGTSLHSPRRTISGRYRTNNGQRSARALNRSVANDPKRTCEASPKRDHAILAEAVRDLEHKLSAA